MSIRERSQSPNPSRNAERGATLYDADPELVDAMAASVKGGGVKAVAGRMNLSDEAVYHQANGLVWKVCWREAELWLEGTLAGKGHTDAGRADALAPLALLARRVGCQLVDESASGARLGVAEAAARFSKESSDVEQVVLLRCLDADGMTAEDAALLLRELQQVRARAAVLERQALDRIEEDRKNQEARSSVA